MQEARNRLRLSGNKEEKPWQLDHCLGLIFLNEGERLKAKDIFQAVINKNPSAWESMVALGRVCEEERAEGQALHIYKEIVRLKAPEIILKGVNYRIKRLSSPDRKLARMIFREKELI